MAIVNIIPQDLNDRLRKGDKIQIIDVREPHEFSRGHIPGAKSIPLSQIPGRMNEIDPNKETVLVCLSGGRSASAYQFLEAQGRKNLKNLMGGMSGWVGEVEA